MRCVEVVHNNRLTVLYTVTNIPLLQCVWVRWVVCVGWVVYVGVGWVVYVGVGWVVYVGVQSIIIML